MITEAHMSVFRLVAAAMAVLGLSAGACAEEAPICSSGVCSFHVPQEMMTSPCSHLSGLVVYSQVSGATLIQFSDLATGESTVFIFDRYATRAGEYEIEDGRYFRAEYLSKLIKVGVPDRFGTVPICNRQQRNTPAVFLVLEKEPTNVDESPYCYRVYQITETGKGIRVQKDDGTNALPTTKSVSARWSKLRKKLVPLIKP